MDYSQFLAMWQEIGLLIVFLLVFLYDTFMPARSLSKLPGLTCILFAVLTGFGFTSWFIESGDAFGGMYQGSTAISTIKNILNIGTLIVLIQSCSWANSEFQRIRRGEFYELILLTLFGMYLMVSAGHFLVFVIGLETASLPLAALIAFEKNKYESHEAAVKYILTAVFSSAIFLMGLSFVYGVAGSLFYNDIAFAISAPESRVMICVALAFVIAGVGFKLSLVTFHLWTADVYQGAPTSVTSYLSVISKGSAAFALLVILWQAFGQAYPDIWEWMMYGLIIATITIGNLFAIRQKNLKRFLAFSSISQAGYIMLGVIGGSALGMTSLVYYILVYMAANLSIFGIVSAVEQHTDGKVCIEDYNGFYRTNPKLAVLMTLSLFSLAGIPPFAGFFSKFFIFAAAFKEGFHLLVFIALLNTVISLYYYLLVVKAMFITPGEHPVPTFRSDRGTRLSLALCTAGVLLLGIASVVYDSIGAFAFGM